MPVLFGVGRYGDIPLGLDRRCVLVAEFARRRGEPPLDVTGEIGAKDAVGGVRGHQSGFLDVVVRCPQGGLDHQQHERFGRELVGGGGMDINQHQFTVFASAFRGPGRG